MPFLLPPIQPIMAGDDAKSDKQTRKRHALTHQINSQSTPIGNLEFLFSGLEIELDAKNDQFSSPLLDIKGKNQFVRLTGKRATKRFLSATHTPSISFAINNLKTEKALH